MKIKLIAFAQKKKGPGKTKNFLSNSTVAAIFATYTLSHKLFIRHNTYHVIKVFASKRFHNEAKVEKKAFTQPNKALGIKLVYLQT